MQQIEECLGKQYYFVALQPAMTENQNTNIDMDTDILFKQSIEDKKLSGKNRLKQYNGFNFHNRFFQLIRIITLSGLRTGSLICAIYALINILKMVLEIRQRLFTTLL
jgi:hypothetical protein